jgi:uncharacterized surface protein with fasciclin (FAS1) repeats
MKRTIARHSSIAALALTLSVGLAACGSDDDGGDSAASDEQSSQMTESPSESMTEEAMSDDQPFGEACASLPASGPGSVDTMTEQPVATAASGNPLLKTLVAAVTKAKLVDTLNSAPELTVFAPTDDAFAEIPKKDLDALLADNEQLTTVLTHHVVEGRLSPDDVAGTHQTLAGDEITVEGSGEDFTAEGATVLCGNVQTANATVYVIDSVMMPTM